MLSLEKYLKRKKLYTSEMMSDKNKRNLTNIFRRKPKTIIMNHSCQTKENKYQHKNKISYQPTRKYHPILPKATSEKDLIYICYNQQVMTRFNVELRVE